MLRRQQKLASVSCTHGANNRQSVTTDCGTLGQSLLDHMTLYFYIIITAPVLIINSDCGLEFYPHCKFKSRFDP